MMRWDVRPLLANQFAVCFSPRLDEPIRVVLGVLESDQAIDFLVQVSIARCELIAEHAQYPEVNLVGSVGIGRVPFRLDIRGVVVQQVVHVMALVLALPWPGGAL
jgi:hypothetical protein